MGYHLSKIRVGDSTVGIADLEPILKEVQGLALIDEAEIREALLSRVKKANYIPSTVEQDYSDALYREYRKSLGEEVPEEAGILEIRVYGGD